MSSVEKGRIASALPDNVMSKTARGGHQGRDEKLGRPEDLEAANNSENDELLQKERRDEETPASKASFASSLAWMVVNTLATIGIVFTNKAIFSDPALKLAQLSFAAFHFFVTWLTLFALSRPRLALFVPRRASLADILPLSAAMSLNVILPNLSLAFSTVAFYQIARILLTPTVAALNYVLYRATLPRNAVLALVPTCLGVAAVTYYDAQPAGDKATTGTTTRLGVVFALAGTAASSLYTVWIGSYHRRLQMSSMQLLFNQAPVAALLLYVIPLVDVLPARAWWVGGGGGEAAAVGARGALVLVSGLFAALINISQFFIVARAGAVSSTVVGHVKTCAIVALGWAAEGPTGARPERCWRGSCYRGIIAYSVVMLKEKEKQAARQRVK